MTWITDGSGTRWIDVPLRKKRASPRAIRFADIKVNDQLMHRWTSHDNKSVTWYYIVTDLWFDPVAGQKDETAGRMVAVRMLDAQTGEPKQRKQSHTLRGLASQQFHYADIDFAAHCKAVFEAKADGGVVSIAFGHAIRRRPKIPGGRAL